MIVSVNERLADQLDITGITELIGRDNLYRGSVRIGAALDQANRDARVWVARHDQTGDGEER